MNRIVTALLLGLLFSVSASAQFHTASVSYSDEDESQIKPNILKLNVAALALKNISIQYERILTRRSSVALGLRYAPETTLPLTSMIKKAVLDEPGTERSLAGTIENATLANFAITPEYRLYLGKGYGQGFYIAPFYRYAVYDVKKMNVTYGEAMSKNIDLGGKFTTNTGGILLGAQWYLAKCLKLDLWILGPGYGTGKGNIEGVNQGNFTPADKEDIRKELDKIDIPLTKKTYEITDNAVKLKLDGPWAGIRSGITVGVKF
ncbi:DUF3575 domain-containing protein [Niabella sp. 22666]|uniref:DUF3575 domain-containing protein n=1 Tax=Niabella sp. 22666 TaxID=3453954 RepID=UPI003F847B2A